MKKLLNRFLREEEGQVIVLFAAAIIVLMGVTAFVVDVGYLQWQKGHLQNTADAAARAGARELFNGGNNGEVEDVVEAYVAAHGIDIGEIQNPGDYVNDEGNTVTVKLEGPRDLYFGKVFNVFRDPGEEEYSKDVGAIAAAGIGAITSMDGGNGDNGGPGGDPPGNGGNGGPGGLLPIGIAEGTFNGLISGGNHNFVEFHTPDYGPGNWGWVYFEKNENAATTVGYLENGYPGVISIGDTIHTNTGANIPAGNRRVRVETALQGYIDTGTTVFIPITADIFGSGGGKNPTEVVGFAAIQITAFDVSPPTSNQWISGKLVPGSILSGPINLGKGSAYGPKGIALIE